MPSFRPRRGAPNVFRQRLQGLSLSALGVNWEDLIPNRLFDLDSGFDDMWICTLRQMSACTLSSILREGLDDAFLLDL